MEYWYVRQIQYYVYTLSLWFSQKGRRGIFCTNNLSLFLYCTCWVTWKAFDAVESLRRRGAPMMMSGIAPHRLRLYGLGPGAATPASRCLSGPVCQTSRVRRWPLLSGRLSISLVSVLNTIASSCINLHTHCCICSSPSRDAPHFIHYILSVLNAYACNSKTKKKVWIICKFCPQ